MRYLVLAALLAICVVSSASATEAKATLTRAQIRQMPLLERPNRPGHFYGNTVRWLHEHRVRTSRS